jgi:hypothetical protein
MHPNRREEQHIPTHHFPPLDQTIHIGAGAAFANLANDGIPPRRRREQPRFPKREHED